MEQIDRLINLKSLNNTTSMITLIIPSLYNLSLIRNQITSEISTSNNIKSRIVRQNVQSALKSCMNLLKNMNQAPTSGMVICSANSCF